MEKANHAMSQDQVDRAVVFLQEIWAKYPDSPLAPQALLRLAEIEQVVHNDPTGSVTMLKRILSKYPNSKEAKKVWEVLGEIYEKDLHDPREALAIYKKGLEKDGEQLPLLAGSVRTLITLGNIEEAEELTEKVLSVPGEEGQKLSLLLGDLFRAKGFLKTHSTVTQGYAK
jgi:tetratricopeptide (TPR) repeat protein